jgi:hypothetical protein
MVLRNVVVLERDLERRTVRLLCGVAPKVSDSALGPFAGVRKPRGIAFADDDTLLMCAQNCVLAVDVTTFGVARVVAEDNDLAGQSLALGAIVARAREVSAHKSDHQG